MGILDRWISNKFAPVINDMVQKSVTINGGTIQRAMGIMWQAFTPINSDTVYTILRKRTQKESSIPLYVYKKKDRVALQKYFTLTKHSQTPQSFQRSQVLKLKAVDEVQIDNDLQRLLQRPNFNMGSDSFWNGVFYEYSMGECFLWKNRGGGIGKPVELVIVQKEYVTVVPVVYGAEAISHYQVSKQGVPSRIEKADMIHWKTYNPQDPTRGLNPLDILKKRLTQDNALTEQATWGAMNHGSDAAIFPKNPMNLNEVQTTQIEDTVNSRVNNSKTRKAVTFLPAEYGLINFGRSADEMQILEQLGWTFERICHAFGIPPEIFLSDATFSNKEWALKNWITNDVMPVIYSLRDELNRSLVPEFGNDLVIDADFTALPEMQDDMKKLYDSLVPLFDRGGLSPNEMRKLGGFDESSDPLHKRYYISSGFAPLSDMDAPAPESDLKNYGDY